MRTYTLNLIRDGEPVKVDLRLTLGSQLALKKKYNENAISTIFGGLDDPEKLATLSRTARNFMT